MIPRERLQPWNSLHIVDSEDFKPQQGAVAHYRIWRPRVLIDLEQPILSPRNLSDDNARHLDLPTRAEEQTPGSRCNIHSTCLGDDIATRKRLRQETAEQSDKL